MRDLGRKAVLGGISTWFGNLGGFLLRFGLNAALARFLTAAELGAYALAATYMAFLSIILSFSFPQALLQLGDEHEDLVPTVFWMSAILVLLLAVLSCAIYPLLVMLHGEDVGACFLVLAGSRCFATQALCLESALQRQFRYHWVAALKVISIGISVAVLVPLAVVWPDPLVYALRDTIPPLIVLCVLGWSAMRKGIGLFRRWNRKTAARVWRLGSDLFRNRSLEVVYHWSDQLVVGHVLGQDALGFYRQARYLSSLPQAAVAPVGQIVGLRTFAAIGDDQKRRSRAFTLTQFVVVRAVMLFAIGAAVASDLVVRVVLGPGWEPTGTLLAVFSVWILILPISENQKALLTAVEAWRPIRVGIVAATVVLLTIIWPLVWELGSLGVVLANIASLLVTVCIMARGRRDWVTVDSGTYGPAFVSGLGALVLGLAVKWLMASQGWVIAALLGLLVAVVGYGALSWWLEGDRLTSELRYVRGQLRRRVES